MRRAVRVVLSLLTAALIAVPALSAYAAEKPVPWKVVDVTVHNDQGSNILLVSGQLPESATLPAQVQLAVPTGSEFQWAGEILGGPPSEDPSVKYTVAKSGDVDVYTFTLTTSRTGQLEVASPSSVTASGQTYTAALKWTSPTDLEQLRLNVRVPQDAQLQSTVEGAKMTPAGDGYSYYQKIVDGVKAGQTEDLSFVYTATAAAGAPAGSPAAGTPATTGGDSAVLVIVLAIAALVIAFGGMAVHRKMQAKSEPAAPVSAASDSRKSAKPTPRAAQAVEDDEVVEGPATAGARRNNRPLIVGLVIVGFIVAGVLAVNSSRQGVATGDTLMMEYAQVDTCTTANLALTPPAGGDLRKDAKDVLNSIRTATGVGNATLYLNESRVEVKYCDSSVSEEAILAALSASGYTGVPTASSEPAPSAPETVTP
jgi:hypothetical protein